MEEFKAGFIAVVGRPNVGKSTLMNAILGQKIAAVSPRPQTTRHRQFGILTLDDVQIVFTDTPGIHNSQHKLGEYMNNEALSTLGESDAILFVVDGSDDPTDEDQLIGEALKQLRNTPVIMAFNKADLLDEPTLTARQTAYQTLAPDAEMLAVSAMHSHNLDTLLASIIDKLPEHPPFYPPDQITDSYERDIAADLIREAALYILDDEVPHSLAVRMDEYTERGDQGAYIEATLFVERDSQKGIVIGKGGKMIKRISTHARIEIEKMSGRKVFLRLRVKVRKNWRNDDNVLRLFGFRGKK